MKNTILALLALLVSSTCFASHSVYTQATPNSPIFGLGIMLGEPTGVTGKVWFDQKSAIDIDFTYSWNHFYNIILDYLYHPNVHPIVKPYVGIGAELFIYHDSYDWTWNDRHYFYNSDSSVAFGIRIPLGVEVMPKDLPMGFFGEIAPGLLMMPGVTGFLQADVGARFYF